MEGKIKPTENSTPRQQEREEITVEREGRRLAEERSKLRSCGRGEARGERREGLPERGHAPSRRIISQVSSSLPLTLPSPLARFSYFFAGARMSSVLAIADRFLRLLGRVLAGSAWFLGV
jgi:hypothetical protein